MKVETKAHRTPRARGGDTITGNITAVMNPRVDGLISARTALLTPNELEMIESSHRCSRCCHLACLHASICLVRDCDCDGISAEDAA